MNLEDWAEKKENIKHLKLAKKDVRDAILKSTAMRLDQINSMCAKAGTSTDGKQARSFFTSETKPVLTQLLILEDVIY